MKNNIIFSTEQYINDQEMPKGKQKVILSAIELFASQGFHGTSTAQLAKNAEVSQATIYKYFETKDELFGLYSRVNRTNYWTPLLYRIIYIFY